MALALSFEAPALHPRGLRSKMEVSIGARVFLQLRKLDGNDLSLFRPRFLRWNWPDRACLSLGPCRRSICAVAHGTAGGGIL
jgi:hypothetical protein